MVVLYRRVNATFKKFEGPTQAQISLSFDLTITTGLTLEGWVIHLKKCAEFELSCGGTQYYLFYFVVMDVIQGSNMQEEAS